MSKFTVKRKGSGLTTTELYRRYFFCKLPSYLEVFRRSVFQNYSQQTDFPILQKS